MSELGAIQSLLAAGDAAGSQAQFAQFLQLLTQILSTLQSFTPASASPFAVNDWTGGDLVISSAFPTINTGTISLKPASPAAMNVTLPVTGGPWLVADGSGFCSPTDQVTFQVASGGTILGNSTFQFIASYQSAIFVRDGTNYLVF